VAPIFGIDLPPVATISDDCLKAILHRSRRGSRLRLASTPADLGAQMQLRAALRISASSMRMMSLALSSQKSWPSVFSCQAMPWRSTMAMKVGRRETGERRLREMRVGGEEILRPGMDVGEVAAAAARDADLLAGGLGMIEDDDRAAAFPARIAHIMPAAPAPMTMTSLLRCKPFPDQRRLLFPSIGESQRSPLANCKLRL
jgi:hypothetical protein